MWYVRTLELDAERCSRCGDLAQLLLLAEVVRGPFCSATLTDAGAISSAKSDQPRLSPLQVDLSKSRIPPISQHWVDATWVLEWRGRWRLEEHINVLELYAETIGMTWTLRKGDPRTPRRIVILQDSQVAVHAGSKGRSSSLPLLRPLRRTAGILLAGNLYVDRLWIPSKANPADGPSRGRAVGVFDDGG